ncbi:hypothetical protein BKA66DRAFT_581391 [Pyrenochaeta sp. MPI-SDFR-AT-0127]|nr:hypothetical protein BKA66DRAFT_581391 [Pyrenochaeta sp. MPI-SDFR-AT-0127]
MSSSRPWKEMRHAGDMGATETPAPPLGSGSARGVKRPWRSGGRGDPPTPRSPCARGNEPVAVGEHVGHAVPGRPMPRPAAHKRPSLKTGSRRKRRGLQYLDAKNSSFGGCSPSGHHPIPIVTGLGEGSKSVCPPPARARADDTADDDDATTATTAATTTTGTAARIGFTLLSKYYAGPGHATARHTAISAPSCAEHGGHLSSPLPIFCWSCCRLRREGDRSTTGKSPPSPRLTYLSSGNI